MMRTARDIFAAQIMCESPVGVRRLASSAGGTEEPGESCDTTNYPFCAGLEAETCSIASDRGCPALGKPTATCGTRPGPAEVESEAPTARQQYPHPPIESCPGLDRARSKAEPRRQRHRRPRLWQQLHLRTRRSSRPQPGWRSTRPPKLRLSAEAHALPLSPALHDFPSEFEPIAISKGASRDPWKPRSRRARQPSDRRQGRELRKFAAGRIAIMARP